MSETRFKEAGQLFFEGRTDPRILIQLFPEIKGKMYRSLSVDFARVFKGLGFLFDGDALRRDTVADISKLALLTQIFSLCTSETLASAPKRSVVGG